MAQLTNKTRRAIELPSRHVIPKAGKLVTTNEVIRAIDNWSKLSGLILSGEVAVAFDPEPEPEEGETVAEAIDHPAPETPATPVPVKKR
ncbi:hypothetical protein [Cereibacter changlensis]|uniref:hypothetical protein n=1 Tax=Cereibacter changlensis TaxID=402884 RepID=UPI00403381E1